MKILQSISKHGFCMQFEEKDFKSGLDLSSIFGLIQHVSRQNMFDAHEVVNTDHFLEKYSYYLESDADLDGVGLSYKMLLEQSIMVFKRLIRFKNYGLYDQLVVNSKGAMTNIHILDLEGAKVMFQGTPAQGLAFLLGGCAKRADYGVIIYGKEFYPCEQGGHFDTLVQAATLQSIKLTDEFVAKNVVFFPATHIRQKYTELKRRYARD